MKELSIEQKAKAYDKALERAKTMIDDLRKGEDILSVPNLEAMFPELKESKDEKVRNKLIEFFKGYSPDEEWWGNITQEDILAWIEKQGKQKTVDEIAKEVCKNKESAMAFLKSAGIMNEKGELAEQYRQSEQNPADKVEPENTPIEGKFPYNNSSDTLEDEIENIWGKLSCQGLFTATKEGFSEVATHFANYLKKQNPIEWSEEDENLLKAILDSLNTYAKMAHPCLKSVVEEEINWLKSLKPQKYVEYNPYKATVESIAEMCKRYNLAIDGALKDFYDNVKVKCKDAIEYDLKQL